MIFPWYPKSNPGLPSGPNVANRILVPGQRKAQPSSLCCPRKHLLITSLSFTHSWSPASGLGETARDQWRRPDVTDERKKKCMHMFTHGVGIQVRSSSGMRLTRWLSLDWSAESFGYSRVRGSHLFAARNRKRRRWRCAAGRDSLPTIGAQCPDQTFLRTGLWKRTPSRNLSLESATLRRRSTGPGYFHVLWRSGWPTCRGNIRERQWASSLAPFLGL